MCIEVNRSILVVVGSSMVVANSTFEAVLPLAILGKHKGLGRKTPRLEILVDCSALNDRRVAKNG